MATLHFICGKAGAGKTTLARELGRTLPAVVFVEDEWIDTLGFEIKSLAEFRVASIKVRKLISSLTRDLLRLGVSVVFDFAGNTRKDRQWVRGIFENSNARSPVAHHRSDGREVPCQHPPAQRGEAGRDLFGVRLG